MSNPPLSPDEIAEALADAYVSFDALVEVYRRTEAEAGAHAAKTEMLYTLANDTDPRVILMMLAVAITRAARGCPELEDGDE